MKETQRKVSPGEVNGKESLRDAGEDLNERERQVLDAVVRTYVDIAEPAGSRTVSRRFELGVSPATIRNTMSDLEEKGYLFHPHTSAGRIPTDLAYRFFVDELIRPARLSGPERAHLARQLDEVSASAVDRLVLRATRALSVLSLELGLAVAPLMAEATLEKLDLIQIASDKVLLVATIQSGTIRTVYVDLPGEVPQDTLLAVALLLNERLAGLRLTEIRQSLPDRLRDAHHDDAPEAEELLNIFMQAGPGFWPSAVTPRPTSTSATPACSPRSPSSRRASNSRSFSN